MESCNLEAIRIFLFKPNHTMITLQKNGVVKTYSTGFSWKYLFFGILYPLARADYKGLFTCLGWSFLTFGFANLVIPFNHNQKHIDRKKLEGWKELQSNND